MICLFFANVRRGGKFVVYTDVVSNREPGLLDQIEHGIKQRRVQRRFPCVSVGNLEAVGSGVDKRLHLAAQALRRIVKALEVDRRMAVHREFIRVHRLCQQRFGIGSTARSAVPHAQQVRAVDACRREIVKAVAQIQIHAAASVRM